MDTAIRLKPTIKSKEQTEDRRGANGRQIKTKIKLYPNSTNLLKKRL